MPASVFIPTPTETGEDGATEPVRDGWPTMAFGSLQIAYDHRVLEPRPWTLMQSAWAAELDATVPRGPILELCSGAGQIGLAAAALTGRRLVQVDASSEACAFARVNADRAGLGRRVEVRLSPLDRAVARREQFALVLADPPYLPRADIGRYPDDPRQAIDGGPDGLDLVRSCLTVIAHALAPGGAALLQVRGRAQADEVDGLAAGTLHVDDVRDDGPERAVALLRRGECRS